MKKHQKPPKPVVVLSKKLSDVLSLMSSTELTLKEIAAKVGMDYEKLCDIYIGKDQRDPETVLFHSGLRKIDTIIKEKTKRLTSENRLIVMEEINELLRDMRAKGDRDDRVLVPILNALAKTTAGVEINANIQNNVFNQMTAEDLVHEYRRLTAITAGTKA